MGDGGGRLCACLEIEAMRLRSGVLVVVIRESDSMPGMPAVGDDGDGSLSCWEAGEAGVRSEFGITVTCDDSRKVSKEFRGIC